MRLEEFSAERLADPSIETLLSGLEREGFEVAGTLASARRRLGLVLLSGKEGKMPLEREELRLARGLLDQASTALETSMLLDERARQAELERELEIAAAIQQSLLPASVQLGAGWEVAAVCRPARQVGGDFFAELPGPTATCHAVVYGDVSGKSVSGALMMKTRAPITWRRSRSIPNSSWRGCASSHCRSSAKPSAGRLAKRSRRRIAPA